MTEQVQVMIDSDSEQAVDEKVINLLMGIKDDVGALRGEVGELRGTLQARPCITHQQEIRDLHARVDGVDARVDEIKQKDLPEFRTALSALDWWSKARNKVLAALIMTLLGIAGAVVGDLLKEALQKAPATSMQMVPPASASPAENSFPIIQQ